MFKTTNEVIIANSEPIILQFPIAFDAIPVDKVSAANHLLAP